MIKLGPRPKTPKSLSGKTVLKKKRELATRVKAGKKLKSTDFSSYWLEPDVREPLWEIHHGKCCYCERKRDIKRESDVEHYRPKAGVTEDSNHTGYWWLAYEWANYLFSCKTCNQAYKKNYFPLLKVSSRASSPEDEISNEKPALLNPFDDDPESCITYDWENGGGIYVKPVGKDKKRRGKKTIEIAGLDRSELMEECAENLSLLKLLVRAIREEKNPKDQFKVNEFAQIIREQTSAKKTFSGFRRAFFKAHGLTEYVATD